MEEYSADERERVPGGSGEPKVEYAAMLLGATGNVGGHILHLLVQSPLCKKVVVVTRRTVAELANAKVKQVVVNMDKLEEELAPHAKGVDIAFAAFGVGKGSAKMADEEVRKIEITYPTAFASAAKAGGSSTKYLRNIGEKEKKCRCSSGRCRLATTRFIRTTWRAPWSRSRSRRSSCSRRAQARGLRGSRREPPRCSHGQHVRPSAA
jgi:hypothetical protein